MVGLAAVGTAETAGIGETGGREVGAQVTGEGTLKALFNPSNEAQQHKPIISLQVIYYLYKQSLLCTNHFTYKHM